MPIEIHDVTLQRAFHAAEVKAKYKLYYVDAFTAALALEHKATLVTSDADFRRLGHSFPVLWLKAYPTLMLWVPSAFLKNATSWLNV